MVKRRERREVARGLCNGSRSVEGIGKGFYDIFLYSKKYEIKVIVYFRNSNK